MEKGGKAKSKQQDFRFQILIFTHFRNWKTNSINRPTMIHSLFSITIYHFLSYYYYIQLYIQNKTLKDSMEGGRNQSVVINKAFGGFLTIHSVNKVKYCWLWFLFCVFWVLIHSYFSFVITSNPYGEMCFKFVHKFFSWIWLVFPYSGQ